MDTEIYGSQLLGLSFIGPYHRGVPRVRDSSQARRRDDGGDAPPAHRGTSSRGCRRDTLVGDGDGHAGSSRKHARDRYRGETRTPEAVRVILDTSFLIDLFDGREGAFERGIELSETNTVQRVPSPVVVELSYGAEFGDEDERRPDSRVGSVRPDASRRGRGRAGEHAGELTASVRTPPRGRAPRPRNVRGLPAPRRLTSPSIRLHPPVVAGGRTAGREFRGRSRSCALPH